MNKLLLWGSVLLGVLLIIIAGMYVITPAGSLPSFMPGYEVASSHMHYKHAVGAFILGVGLFVFAWFKSAPAKNA